MITRAALCPCPPLLAPELTGRTAVAPALRDACAEAAKWLAVPAPGAVVVVGPAAETARWAPDARLDLTAFAPALAAGGPAGTPGLPLSLGLGAMLLDVAGYTGPRVLQAVAESASPADCLRLGAAASGGSARAALLVMGDGSARRAPGAPGHFDERAAPFDRAVERSVRDGDMAALAALDPGLARDLMAAGRAAWQVLAGAFGTSPLTAKTLYADAPFGVWYLVAIAERIDQP